MTRYGFIFAFVVSALVVGVSLATASQTVHKAAPPGPKAQQDEQLYRNATFGFRYKIPYGWVERTEEMREPADANADSADASGASSSSLNPKAASSNKSASDKSGKNKPAASDVLLAVFERPPQAEGASVNSAVVIASEAAAAYPGLKKAEDFLGPLAESTAAQGFKANGDPSVVEIDARELVRADFSKPLTDKLTMYQTTLVLVAKGQVVSFTFVAGSEDEVDDLIEGLHFGSRKASR
ncbi:MAG: hypothetical protein WA609_14060 [Terriglobales bacterium]